jgi:hypothetical protein
VVAAATQRIGPERAVDFGASDMPLTSGELTALGLCQCPIVMGGVLVAINLEGAHSADLSLTGPVLADIFLGKISRWSDSRIKAHNPLLQLPDAAITIIHRSDGSGTTFNFTEYLSKVSPEWKLAAGAAMLVRWPAGTRRERQRRRRQCYRSHQKLDRLCGVRPGVAVAAHARAAPEPRGQLRQAEQRELSGRRRQRRLEQVERLSPVAERSPSRQAKALRISCWMLCSSL